MSKIVSRESLHTLASLAFASLLYDDDARAKPEFNLDCSDELLLRVLTHEHNLGERGEDKRMPFYDGFATGMEFGLDIAAAIVTNDLDSAAIAKAIRAELADSSRYWPAKDEEAA